MDMQLKHKHVLLGVEVMLPKELLLLPVVTIVAVLVPVLLMEVQLKHKQVLLMVKAISFKALQLLVVLIVVVVTVEGNWESLLNTNRFR